MYHIVNDWYHEDDGSNDFDALGRRQTIKAGDWKVMYQPPANQNVNMLELTCINITTKRTDYYQNYDHQGETTR